MSSRIGREEPRPRTEKHASPERRTGRSGPAGWGKRVDDRGDLACPRHDSFHWRSGAGSKLRARRPRVGACRAMNSPPMRACATASAGPDEHRTRSRPTCFLSLVFFLSSDPRHGSAHLRLALARNGLGGWLGARKRPLTVSVKPSIVRTTNNTFLHRCTQAGVDSLKLHRINVHPTCTTTPTTLLHQCDAFDLGPPMQTVGRVQLVIPFAPSRQK